MVNLRANKSNSQLCVCGDREKETRTCKSIKVEEKKRRRLGFALQH